MPDALIHLRVSAATKGRWIRASRAAGMRLTDWIAQAVEAQMSQQLARILVPDDVDFADLRLARDADGDVSFDWTPIERICEASGLSVDVLKDGPEDNVAELITGWYNEHIRHGGTPDATAEDLLTEIRAEDAAGQHASHKPGLA
ncbi:hypothetical protein ACMHYO_11795 [Allopusillimonas ginsengisoli]|uniref:hypothetical protein n=1 Tax=Allopusillimonas ginsengisoli TaxID=453575 RepID=UPI0039C34149